MKVGKVWGGKGVDMSVHDNKDFMVKFIGYLWNYRLARRIEK